MWSAAYVPIRVADNPIGVIALYGDRQGCFSTQDLALLEDIGSHVGLAVAFALVEGQRQRLAVYRERVHLAQVLHDVMLQSLASLGLYTKEMARDISAGDVAGAAALVDEVLAVINETERELRGSIRRLSGGRSTSEDFYEVAIRMKRRAESAGIAVSLDLQETRLAPEASAALSCICREAVTNVLKHSEAARLSVSFRAEEGCLELVVADDGVGFGLEPVPPDDGHLGLALMQRRAREAGGTLSIDFHAGVSVRCRIPA
jgi:signal transduction histidine kinase